MLLVLAAVGCSSGGGSPKDADDFVYNPPAGLTQQSQQRNGNTVFEGPVEDGFKTTLQVKSDSTNSSAEQFGKKTLQDVTAQGNVTVKEQEPFQIPDSDAYTWLIEKKGKSGKLAEQRQFVVVKNRIAVLFTMTAIESAMPKWDQALADSLQSFKWGK